MKRGSKEIIGIDIAEEQIAIVVLKTAPELAIKDFVIKELPKTLTDNELSKIIEDMFSKKRWFKKEVWLNIDSPEPRIVFRRLSLPVMPPLELPNAIKWNMKDKISLDVKDAFLGYEIVGELQKEDGSRNLDIMAVLAEKNLIGRFLDLFKKAGIALSGINVTPLSIVNALKFSAQGLGPQEKEAILVCHIGVEYTYLCVCAKGKLAFVRQLPLAKQSFINAMTGVLVSDKGRTELTHQDAKKIMSEFGIPNETDKILDGRIMPNQIIAMVRPVIERFIEDLLRSIDYYQGEFKSRIAKFLLTGEGPNIKGLGSFISKGLNLDVEYLKDKEGFLLPPAAIGAAVGYRGEINLLPDELKQKRQDEIKKGVLRVSTLVVLGIFFLSFLTVSIQTASYKKQLELMRKQRLILKDLKDMQDRIGERTSVISNITEREIPVDVVLKELSNITPGNVAFVELWQNQKQRQLKLRGRVSARPEAVQGILSDFMEQLEKTLFIKDAHLLNVQKETVGAGEGSAFEIACILKIR